MVLGLVCGTLSNLALEFGAVKEALLRDGIKTVVELSQVGSLPVTHLRGQLKLWAGTGP